MKCSFFLLLVFITLHILLISGSSFIKKLLGREKEEKRIFLVEEKKDYEDDEQIAALKRMSSASKIVPLVRRYRLGSDNRNWCVVVKHLQHLAIWIHNNKADPEKEFENPKTLLYKYKRLLDKLEFYYWLSLPTIVTEADDFIKNFNRGPWQNQKPFGLHSYIDYLRAYYGVLIGRQLVKRQFREDIYFFWGPLHTMLRVLSNNKDLPENLVKKDSLKALSTTVSKAVEAVCLLKKNVKEDTIPVAPSTSVSSSTPSAPLPTKKPEPRVHPMLDTKIEINPIASDYLVNMVQKPELNIDEEEDSLWEFLKSNDLHIGQKKPSCRKFVPQLFKEHFPKVSEWASKVQQIYATCMFQITPDEVTQGSKLAHESTIRDKIKDKLMRVIRKHRLKKDNFNIINGQINDVFVDKLFLTRRRPLSEKFLSFEQDSDMTNVFEWSPNENHEMQEEQVIEEPVIRIILLIDAMTMHQSRLVQLLKVMRLYVKKPTKEKFSAIKKVEDKGEGKLEPGKLEEIKEDKKPEEKRTQDKLTESKPPEENKEELKDQKTLEIKENKEKEETVKNQEIKKDKVKTEETAKVDETKETKLISSASANQPINELKTESKETTTSVNESKETPTNNPPQEQKKPKISKPKKEKKHKKKKKDNKLADDSSTDQKLPFTTTAATDIRIESKTDSQQLILNQIQKPQLEIQEDQEMEEANGDSETESESMLLNNVTPSCQALKSKIKLIYALLIIAFLVIALTNAFLLYRLHQLSDLEKKLDKQEIDLADILTDKLADSDQVDHDKHTFHND